MLLALPSYSQSRETFTDMQGVFLKLSWIGLTFGNIAMELVRLVIICNYQQNVKLLTDSLVSRYIVRSLRTLYSGRNVFCVNTTFHKSFKRITAKCRQMEFMLRSRTFTIYLKKHIFWYSLWIFLRIASNIAR